MNVLDTITAKLDRAHEHLEVLDNAVLQFHKNSPYTFRNKFKSKGENLYDWIFTIHIHHEIPLRISAIFGDGIQNIRSTLDYLAYQLAVKNVGLNGDLDGVEFPIFCDHDRYMAIDKGKQWTKGNVWKKSGLYKIRSIESAAQTTIESLQPYHGGDNVLLWQIHELSIIDKHRHLHIVSHPLGDWRVGRPLGDGLSPKVIKGLTIRQSIINSPPFKDGAEVARFEVAVLPDFDFKVRVKYTIPGEVVLNEIGLSDAYAGRVLAGLIGFVRKRIIPQFLPFLK